MVIAYSPPNVAISRPEHIGPGIALRRHNRDFPCPICGGHVSLPKGQGRRCAGFNLDLVAYCTREQHAGSLLLDISTSPPAYRHSLLAACGCGQRHGGQYFTSAPFPTAVIHLEHLSIAERTPDRAPAPIEVRHVVYSAALGLLDLREQALDDLIGRGLSLRAIALAGYRSIPRPGTERRTFMAEMVGSVGEELIMRCPGFTDKNGRLTFWTASGTRDGYIVPYRDEYGFITGMQQKVLDGKYLTARGSILSSVHHLAGTGGPGRDL